MREKSRRVLKKLSVRLLAAMCAICIPMNLLTILVAGIMLQKAGKEVKESYQRELDIVMEQFEEGLYKLESDTDDFVSQYLTELMLEAESDNMVSYEMVYYLKDILAKNITGLFYLYDKNEELLFLKSSYGGYGIGELEEMKEKLLENIPRGNSEQWQCRKISDTYFYIRYYEYTNYKLGYMVDLNKNLEELLGNSMPEHAAAFFECEEYQGKEEPLVLKIENFLFEMDKDGQKQELAKTKWNSIWVERKVKDLGFELGVWISGSHTLDSIPVLYWCFLLLAVVFAVLLIFFWKLLQSQVVKPLNTLQVGMKELEANNHEYRIMETDTNETEDFRYIYEVFNHMAEEIRLSHEKDMKMYQVQLDNLKLQVNPHMLLNSLNMIYSLAQTKDYECIQEFSLLLVDYFRYSLKESNTFVLLKNEMQFVDNYVKIQKIRFPGSFICVYNITEEVKDAVVPPLLIQNFVENAMKYALIPGKMIEVLINIRKEEDRLLISICDTGRGIKSEVLKQMQKGEIYVDKIGRKHIGVWNCRRRMEVFYGERASMNIVSTEGEGTQVWMDLPYIEAPNERNTD